MDRGADAIRNMELILAESATFPTLSRREEVLTMTRITEDLTVMRAAEVALKCL